MDDRPYNVSITGDEDDVDQLEHELNDDIITRLVEIARANDVVISVSIAPFDDTRRETVDRDPND
jgi:hypothetical protein